jgi:hypothetical protein
MAVDLLYSFFLFFRQRVSFILYHIIPIIVDIPFLCARGELRAFGLAVWMGGSRAMAVSGILFAKARYMAVAVAFEASLHLCGKIIGFANEDLRFL